MDRQQLEAYLGRGWEAAAALKGEHWAREWARRGPTATLEASLALWEQMRAVRPDWPTDDERRDDLAHHIALKRLIERVACAFVAPGAR